MYDDWFANATVVAATIAAVSLSVLVHYEGLLFMSRRLARPEGMRRVKVLYAIFGVVALHVSEIWIFGLTYWMLLQWPGCGQLGGEPLTHLFDAVYFSATTFSTLGYGDIAPLGPIRFLAGTESLIGLVLITWSASFTYLEMEKFWRSS
ncbi:MAG TPA: potassium channel family protein [Burkholderiales bacterium]